MLASRGYHLARGGREGDGACVPALIRLTGLARARRHREPHADRHNGENIAESLSLSFERHTGQKSKNLECRFGSTTWPEADVRLTVPPSSRAHEATANPMRMRAGSSVLCSASIILRYRGTSLTKNSTPSHGRHRALGILLL